MCVRLACYYGHLEIVKFLLKMYYDIYIDKIDKENEDNDKYVCYFMFSQIKHENFKSNPDNYINKCFGEACSGDNLEIVKYIYNKYNKYNDYIDFESYHVYDGIMNAFNYTYYEIINYVIPLYPHVLHSMTHDDFHHELVEYVILNDLYQDNLFELFDCLYECHKNDDSDNYIDGVSMVIDKLHEQSDEVFDLFKCACDYGLLDIAKIIIKKIPDVNLLPKIKDIQFESIEITKWLHDGCPIKRIKATEVN